MVHQSVVAGQYVQGQVWTGGRNGFAPDAASLGPAVTTGAVQIVDAFCADIAEARDLTPDEVRP